MPFQDSPTSEEWKAEWDYPIPLPPPTIYPSRLKWAKRFADFRNQPGRTARVLHGITPYDKVSQHRENIKRAFAKDDPYARWRLETHRESDYTWSLYLTYEGQMTEKQYIRAQQEKAARALEMKRARERRRIEREMIGLQPKVGNPRRKVPKR